MRCLYSAIVILIIFFKESDASDSNSSKWSWNRVKLRLPKEEKPTRGAQSRLDIVGTPKRMSPQDFNKLRRTPSMDLVTQHELKNHQARPDESHAMNLLTQYKAQHPRSRPKSPRNSLRKNNPPVDSNLLYQAELGPAPPNQVLMNGETLSESQMYQMGLQRYGKYDPLHTKPPKFPSNSEASGSYYGTAGGATSGASGYPNTQPDPYFGTEAEPKAYHMSGQHQGRYALHHPDPPYFGSDSEHSGSGYHY